MGVLLINLNDGDVGLLLLVKAIGTIVACAILLRVYSSHHVLGLWLCGILALVQLALLVYLENM